MKVYVRTLNNSGISKSEKRMENTDVNIYEKKRNLIIRYSDRTRAPIGIFDSGVGGLTVAREVIRQLPAEKVVYFGDTARVPYGSKSKETVTKYSRQIIRFLKTKDVKAIVIACNTASAYALQEISEEIEIPIIGVVIPGANVAALTTKNKRVGIIGTEGTINSKIYSSVIDGLVSGITVIGKACPLFVPLVEEGMVEDPVTTEIAGRYLGELKEKDIDTLILGCTHYPLIRKTVGDIMGDKITMVNPAYETAKELKKLLEQKKLLSHEEEVDRGAHEFYVSDAADKFKKFADTILKFEIANVEKINIEEY